jgi:hypothetical protein
LEEKMAECDWAILCDYAFQDSGRKTCLIGVFDRIFAVTVPTVLPQAAMGIKLLGSPGEHVAFRVEIIRPTGGQLATFGGEVVISETGSLEVSVRMAGMQLPDFGVYALNVYATETLARTVSFLVARPPQGAQQGNQPQ